MASAELKIILVKVRAENNILRVILSSTQLTFQLIIRTQNSSSRPPLTTSQIPEETTPKPTS
ncbi:hypothetical protein C922_05717 [Plasmodium inui San Antonio 1]|uniref:Uncharacterized protein n=1 Tax=Plasmodium inui San Antonio 1 TaxID=1237626 RepID=W7A485_9APIC|nr:hypothetical protein C922_05717 [Plasmodium inui San Antonio 1]EUD63904.1 hypothetical protein C922_05717 [Plasmodium inui San Antonio 1]